MAPGVPYWTVKEVPETITVRQSGLGRSQASLLPAVSTSTDQGLQLGGGGPAVWYCLQLWGWDQASPDNGLHSDNSMCLPCPFSNMGRQWQTPPQPTQK